MNLDNILNTVKNTGNMGGISTTVFFGLLEDFAELASKPKSDLSLDNANLLSEGTHRMKPGKRIYELYSTQEKGVLSSARQGNVDSISHRHNISIYQPGLSSKALGLLNIPNQNFVFFVESGDKMFRVGSKQFPAKLDADGETTSGTATGDERGSTMNFYSFESGPFGEIPDPDAIKALTIAEDTDLTATFTPSHGSMDVLVDVTPTIDFSKAVINADTGLEPTNAELDSLITLEKLDADHNVTGSVAFTAVIATNTVTVTPAANFDATSIFRIKFDKTKILAADTGQRAAGDNYAIFHSA